MTFPSFRENHQYVEETRELLRFEGAVPEEENGGLTELVSSSQSHPMLCFDKIKRYPRGFRFAAKPLVGIRQMALAWELDPELDHVKLFRGWKGQLKTYLSFFSQGGQRRFC